jgi:hypothetical protein
MVLEFIPWLHQSIPYDDTYVIKDILNSIIHKIVIYVNSTPELEFDYVEDTFRQKFYKMIYTRYYRGKVKSFEPYDDELYEYFNMKFSDDILTIWVECRELVMSYNIHLFTNRGDCHLDFIEFLFHTLLVEDPYIDKIEENMDYSIDESYL